MGTNYYLHYDVCDHCDRYKELHIGKNSCGWKFVLRSYEFEGLFTWDKWLDFLRTETDLGSKIINENGLEYSLIDFVDMVQNKQFEKKSHLFTDDDYLDVRGFNFSKTEFS